MNRAKRHLKRYKQMRYRMIFHGVFVGLITGAVVALFRISIETLDNLRGKLIAEVGSTSLLGDEELLGRILLYILLLVAMGIIVFLIGKWQPLSAGSGIPQVKGELRGQINQPTYPLLIGKFLGAMGAMGAGLSLGREGPSIQLGALVGKAFARGTRQLPVEEKMLLTCGAGAGLAGAFCAPLAGAIFALEELHKNFSSTVLVSTLAASISANFVSAYIFGQHPVFALTVTERFPLHMYWVIAILGAVLGVLGSFYNKVMLKSLRVFDKTPRFLSVFISLSLCLMLAFLMPEVLGGGHVLVEKIAGGLFELGEGFIGSAALPIGILGGFLLLLVIKFLFSVVSFGAGVPGGIFLPLLVLGSIVGGLFGHGYNVVAGLPETSYIANFVIVGMVGMFAAIVRAPVTGIILITEMTGNFDNFFSLVVVGLVAYVVADFTGSAPIYDLLLDRLVEKKVARDYAENNEKVIGRVRTLKHRAGRKVLIETEVYIGSPMDGGKVSDMLLPSGCLVISLIRGGKEIVPSGETVTKGGDQLVILCAVHYQSQVLDKLDRICKTIKV